MQHQPIFIQQQKIKPVTKLDTSMNQIDQSNQSMQQDASVLNPQDDEKGEPQSNKNFLTKKTFPFMYAPIQKRSSVELNSEVPVIECWHILFPQFKTKSATFILIVLLSLYFLSIYIYHYVGTNQLLGCTLYEVGANFTPVIRYKGHVHRLIVSIPLFGSILHAIISLLTLLMFGFVLEQYIGRLKYILLLVVSAFFSNLLSAIAYPYYVTVGSVGFIFGLIALNISFIINNCNQFGQQRNLVISLFILMIMANFLSMIDTKAIDIAGIFGGFVSGGLLSIYFYTKKEISARFRRIQLLSLFLLFVLTITFLSLIFSSELDDIDISAWCP